MAGKFELYRDKAGEYRFRLKAGNGEKILASEGHKDWRGAMNAIESVRKNSQDPNAYERKYSTRNKPYFVLKALNRVVIGNSEMYESDASCENGIKSVMNNAPDAVIDDQTQ